MPGITTSSSTRSGGSARCARAPPRRPTPPSHVVALDRQQVGEQLHVARRVVDDEDRGSCVARAAGRRRIGCRRSLRSLRTEESLHGVEQFANVNGFRDVGVEPRGDDLAPVVRPSPRRSPRAPGSPARAAASRSAASSVDAVDAGQLDVHQDAASGRRSRARRTPSSPLAAATTSIAVVAAGRRARAAGSSRRPRRRGCACHGRARHRPRQSAR